MFDILIYGFAIFGAVCLIALLMHWASGLPKDPDEDRHEGWPP